MDEKIELLERLAAMRKAGTLSGAEFEEQKCSVLASLGINASETEGRAYSRPSGQFAEDAQGFLARIVPHLKVAGAVVSVACVAAIAVPVAQSLGFSRPNWEGMDTPTLEHEFQRATMTGMKKWYECSHDGNDESCNDIKPTFSDAVAMGNILCSRNPNSDACGQRDNAKGMLEGIDAMEQMGNAMAAQQNDLFGYEHQ